MRAAVFSLALTGAVSAASVARNCFAQRAVDLADYADCGDRSTLAACLSTVQSNVESCYIEAGCTPSQAAKEAQYASELCAEYGADLRKRYNAAIPAQTVASGPQGLMPRATASSDTQKTGTDCFSTTSTSTSTCPVATVDGKKTTQACQPSMATSSDCLKGWICTHDSTNTDVCMLEVNKLDTGGLIIAILFASIVVIGIGYLTFACCNERKQHKRAAAKAEAVALARAATKKKRNQEVRQPLMQEPPQTQQPPQQYQGGYRQDMGANPFQDQAA